MACNLKPFRSHDYIYDPTFIVSSARDYEKMAIAALMQNVKYQVCPVFSNMFSDMSNRPSKQYVMRHPAVLPPSYQNQQNMLLDRYKTNTNIHGQDRYKYFAQPLAIAKQDLFTNVFPNAYEGSKVFLLEQKKSMKPQPKFKKRKVQTKCRESEAQTIPWEPPYKVIGDEEPELLMLDFLKWGSGLPAGMHEVKLIERARMKRAWEKKLRTENDGNMNKLRLIIEAIEKDEWLFREQEIQDLQDLRLQLLENMLNELNEKAVLRNKTKLDMFIRMKESEKNKKIEQLKHKTKRELRKLKMNYDGNAHVHKPMNITKEHNTHTSELYAPLMCNGENPKHWHLVINESLKPYQPRYFGVEEYDTLPVKLKEQTKMKDCCCFKLPGTRLCMRETKWTTPILKQLHNELKELNNSQDNQECSLLKRKEVRIVPEILTPEVEGVTNEEEDQYQACVFIQAILRGRASQTIIYEGRDRCRQLIEDLKYSSGLLSEQKEYVHFNKIRVELEQKDEFIRRDCIMNLLKNLNEIKGNIVGTLLDFLNKELRRLLEERRIHALCMYLERERNNREGLEAGRRQKELHRRREHDEMFKQIMKIQQDTIELYLEDIIKEGVEFTSEEESREYITNIAKTIDETTNNEEFYQNDDNEKEEFITGLVHHFILPKVQKSLIRNQWKFKQQQQLKIIHNEVYTEVERTSKQLYH